MIIDLIMKSFKVAWGNAGGYSTIPAANIYYDRSQQPNGIAGFPYMKVLINRTAPEVITLTNTGNPAPKIATYYITIEIWSIQGMAMTFGDQITDQNFLVRGLENVMNYIPPNTPWFFVTGFLHCLPGNSSLNKYSELYLGKDVYVSTSEWTMLVQE